MAAREGDTALWLHNKLGSTDDLWSGNSICSQLTRDKLLNIQQCFYNLQPYVKVKLMLALLHLPKRNVEEWQHELRTIMELAQQDTDQWVAMVAELLKTYPTHGILNTQPDTQHRFFHEVLTELKKLVKKSSDAGMLPLECSFLSRNAMAAAVGQQNPPPKHFALKRKPKSAALRAELLQKSVEAANNLRKNSTTHSIPVKMRSFAKKADSSVPMKGIPSRTPMPGGFLRSNSLASRSFGGSNPLGHRHSNQKEGGIKLLDITEQPMTSKDAKRRRKIAETKAAEQKKETESQANQTPDYAAGLVSSNILNLNDPVAAGSNLTTTGPSYAPNTISRITATSAPITVIAAPVSNATQQARDNLQMHLQQQLGQTATTLNAQTQHVVTTTQPAVVMQPAPQPQSQAELQPGKQKMKIESEQYKIMQDIFSKSPILTQNEKNLILCFAAGLRNNPCPEKGDVINIRLSEGLEYLHDGGLLKPMMKTSFMQLNYATGEWKQLTRYTEHNPDQ